MEIMECLETRRSIRQYNNDPVTKTEIEAIIKEAAFAPSWKNTQTTRYIAVLDKETKRKIGEDCCMGFAGNAHNINGASALIVLTTIDKRSGFERDSSFSTSKGTHWQSFDAGIACQTLCLAAHALGIGTVVMGIYDEAKVKETLHMPEEQSVSALISLGHYDTHPNPTPRKSVAELLTYK